MDLINFYQQNPSYFYGGVFILGLIIGSFLNVVIHRLPIMMEQEWLQNAVEFLKTLAERPEYKDYESAINQLPEEHHQEQVNLVFPQSHCPKCNHKIKAWENIPLISYLFLKGKCSNCKTHISIRYPLIELVTALLSIAVAIKFGFTYATLAGLFFTWALISLSAIDFDLKLLPDDITLPLLWLGLLVNTQGIFTSLQDAVLGAAFGYLALWSVFWVYKLLTKKEGMGYGDFKLLAALGAWMGWQQLPLIIVLSSFVGAVVGLSLILTMGRDKDIPIPFGPYLAAAGWIALLWGDFLMDSYLQFTLI